MTMTCDSTLIPSFHRYVFALSPISSLNFIDSPPEASLNKTRKIPRIIKLGTVTLPVPVPLCFHVALLLHDKAPFFFFYFFFFIISSLPIQNGLQVLTGEPSTGNNSLWRGYHIVTT